MVAVLLWLLTRWPLVPRWLVNFDLANFAFALDEFSPAEHKPQPPGYPLFVGLTRLLRLFSDDPMVVFAVAGLAGCLVAIVALFRQAELMFGLRAAIASTVLLLLHPALWTAGLLNPVRVFLATGSAVIGLLAWKSWHRDANRWWTVGLWAAIGLTAGFRPGLAVLMLPVGIAATLRRRSSAADWAMAAAALVVSVGSWLVVCARGSGGMREYLLMLGRYLDDHSARTSILFGAPLLPALAMAGEAILWTAAPAIAWVWLVPLLPRSVLTDAWRKAGLLVVLWMGPSFLFSTLVHSAEPGHVLPMVPPLCLIGAFVLGHLRRPRIAGVAVAVSAAIHIALFYWPPLEVLRPASAVAVRTAARQADDALSLVRELQREGPLTLVASPAAAVGWRVLSYYHRDRPLVVLHSNPESAASPRYWLMRNGDIVAEGLDVVPLPDSGKVIWFLSAQSPLPEVPGVPDSSKRVGGAIVTDMPKDTRVRLANYVLITPTASSTAGRWR